MVEIGKTNIRIPVKRMRCARGSFRYKTISMRKGIKGLFCCPAKKFRKGRCSNGMKLVTVLYAASKWTPKRAKKHAKSVFKR